MYIRNIQLNKDTEIAQTIRKINPDMVEESAWSVGKTDFVVSFPIISKTGSLTKDSMIGINHLDLIKKAQANWVNTGANVELCADPGIRHNVSNTVIVRDWDEIEEYVFNNRNFFAGISFLSETGDKDYYQAPNTEVLNSKEIIKRYGTGSLFASGVIVESLKTFSNLWIACNTAQGYGEDVSADNHENALKKEWIRRFKKFAENYFKGDLKKTEYCLKDVYLLHKWEKIQKTFINIEWKDELKEIRYIDVDTMGAAACVGTKDGEGCLI
jgi:ribonucleoside-diphosphate reductase alpha chain